MAKPAATTRHDDLMAAVQAAPLTPDMVEVTAISLCVTILGRLRTPERVRVMRYLIDRYGFEWLVRQAVVAPVDDRPDGTEQVAGNGVEDGTQRTRIGFSSGHAGTGAGRTNAAKRW